MRLFVFGLGYSARAAVELLRPRLEAWGTTRDAAKLAGIAALGVEPLLFDSRPDAAANADGDDERPGTSSTILTLTRSPFDGAQDESASPPEPVDGPGEERISALLDALGQADHVLVSIAPDEAGEPVLRNFGKELAGAGLKSVVYLSTVGVYGDHGGGWVDEASECRPLSRRSVQRLKAEAEWRRFGEATGVPVAIVRLAGIYGPGRGPFEKIRRGTARRIVKPGQVFNRIHAEDIAKIVEAALLRQAAGIFNGADDEPAPPQDVLAFAAELLGLPPPPEVSYEDTGLSPMAQSFYGESKRVRNGRIKAELGVRLSYPTYREGLAAVLRAERGVSCKGS